ncbi:MAG: recombinase family protein [Proteobacteria bacterium]|nr:recombinase family protein [Pseudomonadota bacterium]
MSFRAIANELNRREIRTPRNRHWHAASVYRLVARLSKSARKMD